MRLCVCVFCARCDAQRIKAHETKQNKTEVCVLRCEQNKNNDKIRHKRIKLFALEKKTYTSMMAPPGVAALRSGRNKGNVSYANDEEGFGGAALSNTTLASEDEEEEDEFDNDEEDEDDEDEDEEEEEDSESEGEEDGDDEEEDSGSENKRAKKKQRFAAPNGENNKKRKRTLARTLIANAMKRDETNFLRNEDAGTYSLAKELKKKETMTKEEIESAVKKIIDNKVLANAKTKANEFNFTEGSGAYVALVVLLAGEAVEIKSMTPTTIEKFARQLGLEGKTKNVKKTKMGGNSIRMAMKSDNNTNYFLVNEDAGTYFLANKLEKKKETKKKKETRGRFHVQKNNWEAEAGKFPGIKFFKKEWCPLCNGRTVVRDGSYSYLLFFSHDYLWNQTKRLQESARGGNEVTIEAFRDILRSYFERKLHKESCVTDFKSFQRVDGHICYDCLIDAENYFKVEIEQN